MSRDDDDWIDEDDWADHGWDDAGPGATGGGWPAEQGPVGDERYEDWLAADGPAEIGTEWVDHRPPMGRGRRLLLGLGIVGFLVVAVVGAGYWWVQSQIDPGGEPGAEVELEIATGSTTEDIGAALADNGVISSAMVWDYWTRLNDEGPFQAGFYVFQENSSFDDAVAVLEAGPRPPETESVTVPEGLTIAETVPRLADPEVGVERWAVEEIQAALASGEIRSQFQPGDQPSMEGMLFPDTYAIDEDTDERSFLRRMVTQLDETLIAAEVETKAAGLGLTPYQVVILASLIEEEARVPEDRGKISRVIHNRLAQGIPLGIDATSRYEAEIQGRSRDDIDFESDSPYNTRRVQGLPPTPIAGAGAASIEAALNPEPGEWLFYVLADAEGNHTFTETNAEFLQAKQRCIELDLGCG